MVMRPHVGNTEWDMIPKLLIHPDGFVTILEDVHDIPRPFHRCVDPGAALSPKRHSCSSSARGYSPVV